jgi:hypothetical protein
MTDVVPTVPQVTENNYSEVNRKQAEVQAMANQQGAMGKMDFYDTSMGMQANKLTEQNGYDQKKMNDSLRNNLRERMGQINQISAQMMNGSMA